MERIYSLDPVIDSSSRILILGSMPGKASLEKGQYYAHRNNQFWKIIYALFNCRIREDYPANTEFLLSRRISLWDTIRSCKRSGSLDADIRDIIPNDIPGLFKDYPGISAVFFNGGKAEAVYRKYININPPGNSLQDGIRLYSTSPACTVSCLDKLAQWKCILEYL